MTFLSNQSFDDEGKINVIVKRRRILESGEVDPKTGTLKGKARIKFDYGSLTKANVIPFGNELAAEVFVLEEGEVFWGMSTPPLNHVDKDCHLAHRISLAASNIAGASKCGAGNTIVCHPSLAARVNQCFDKVKTVDQFNPKTEELEEVQKPYFIEPLEVIEHDLAPDNAVLVIYRGQEDGDQPLIYVDGEGLIVNNEVAPVETYGKFVRMPQ